MGDGFKWPKRRRDYFFNKLNKNPDSEPIAAIAKSKNKITIAILIIYQGLTEPKQNRKVFNLASWYALPEKRGVEVIVFAKFFISSLKHGVITNYTANAAAKKILLTFGFKSMPIKMSKFQIFPKPSKNLLFHLFKHKYNQDQLLISQNCLKNLHHLQSNNLLKNDSSDASYFSTWEWKKFRIPLKLLNIYIKSKETFLIPSTFTLLKLMLRNKATHIRLFYRCDALDEPSNPWLILGGEDCDFFIFPSNSELEILQ